MLIDDDLLRFCAAKTSEISAHYERDCILQGESGFPRSCDDLHHIMMGIHGKPIFHRQLRTHFSKARYRSFYIPYGDRVEIYYASGMSRDQVRFYKTKELMQIHLAQESMKTRDIVDLVANMIIRESPASLDLNLGHSTTSDTLGEIAAMQFLFPISEREKFSKAAEAEPIEVIAEKYGVPAFVIQRSFAITPGLIEFF